VNRSTVVRNGDERSLKALAIFEERSTLLVENKALTLEHGSLECFSSIAKKFDAKKINIDYVHLHPELTIKCFYFPPGHLKKAVLTAKDC